MRRVIYLGLALAWASFAQTQVFDAVSVKPNNTGSTSSSSNSHHGVLTGTNVNLRNFIMRAYGLLDYQIIGPEWIVTERFDISAKPPEGTKDADLPLMLRAMLQDRFKLQAHKDSKIFPVYGLIAGKNGPKFQAVEEKGNQSTNSSRGFFKCEQCTMFAVAGWLSRQMDRPVLDMTQLPGVYNLILNFTPENAEPVRSDGNAEKKEAYPPLLTAIQEQWGLKLEPRKAPLEVLVIDHVEKVPTEN